LWLPIVECNAKDCLKHDKDRLCASTEPVVSEKWGCGSYVMDKEYMKADLKRYLETGEGFRKRRWEIPVTYPKEFKGSKQMVE